MKKILITGENSYIGSMFTDWVKKWPDKYSVDKISVRGDKWEEIDFNNYDVVFHVAAIVHKKETKKNTALYFKVNRDLSFEVAKKAKNDGVSQFLFMSTMNIYGIDRGVITRETPCKPKTMYGKSKLEAEKMIKNLQEDNFSVAIIRPPMVYGPNTVGNYLRLSKLARKTPVFPKIDNRRSMIYIDNLSEFIRLIIEQDRRGIFFPQNFEYVNTSSMVRLIAEFNNHKIWMTKIGNPLIKRFFNSPIINKVFGNLYYEKSLSNFENINYQIKTFDESIRISEKETNN